MRDRPGAPRGSVVMHRLLVTPAFLAALAAPAAAEARPARQMVWTTTPVERPAGDSQADTPRPVSSCQFVEPVALAPPSADEPVILAVVRREGDAVSAAAPTAVLRRAIEDACRTAARDCQTDETGERQVRVTLVVRSERDWQLLYARLQALAELGNHGVVF